MYAPQYRSRCKPRFYAQSYIHIVESAGPLPGVELHARASAFANRYRDSHAGHRRHRHAFVYPTANLPACRRRNTDPLAHASGNPFAHRQRDYCLHTGSPGDIHRRACAFSRAR